MAEESSSIDKVLSGEMKLEYIDQLELLKENLSSNSFLNNRSCLLYTSPSPRDRQKSRMPSSA